MQKLLISLPTSYDSIYSMIEHSKDLDTIEVKEVVASLKGYEQRLERHIEKESKERFLVIVLVLNKLNSLEIKM